MRKFFIIELFKLLIIALIGGVVFYSAASLFVRPVYFANTILRITSASESDTQEAERRKLNTYNEALNSSKIRDQVLGNLEIRFSPNEYRKKVEVGRIGDSNLYGIKIRDSIAQRAVDLSNESAEVFQKEIASFVDGETIEIVDEAKMPVQADWRMRKGAAVIGVLIGLFIGVMKKMKKTKDDDSFMFGKALKERFDYPVLGEIPQINKESQKASEISELFKEDDDEKETV